MLSENKIKDTKLIKILMTFSNDELKKFVLFVNSPYFNKLNNVTKLLVFLKKYHPNYTNKRLTRENIFSYLFPGKDYDDIKIRSLFSYLTSLAEKFKASEAYFSRKFDVNIDIVKELAQYNSDFFALQNLDKACYILDKSQNRDSEYYLMLYKYLFMKNSFANFFKGKVNFNKEANALTVYYITTVFRIYTSIYNAKNSLQVDFNSGLIEMIEKLASNEPYSNIPVVKLSRTLYKVAKYNEEKYFFDFLELTEKYPSVFSEKELHEIFITLVNFCVLNIQKGNKKFIKIKFDIYKKIIIDEKTRTEKYFPYAFFNNIVASALENDEPEFAEKFIENYKEKLDPKNKNNIVEICYAKLNYHLKKYDIALSHLSKAGNSDDIFYKFALKDLTIKVYYEKKEYESIFSIIDSYRHLIYNSSLITSEVKNKYKLYLKMLESLLKVSDSQSADKRLELITVLNNSPGFVNKDWILQKLSG